jgi:putative ABC transport system permease protein
MEMVLVQGILLGAAGIAIGVVGALGVTRPMTSTLFGAAATDPTPFAAVALLLTGAALVACYLATAREQ